MFATDSTVFRSISLNAESGSGRKSSSIFLTEQLKMRQRAIYSFNLVYFPSLKYHVLETRHHSQILPLTRIVITNLWIYADTPNTIRDSKSLFIAQLSSLVNYHHRARKNIASLLCLILLLISRHYYC